MMLIITMGPASAAPEVLSGVDWSAPRIAVLLPGSALSRPEIDDLLARGHVIEFLTPPDGVLAIIAEICLRLEALFETAEGPFVFVNRPASAGEIAAIIDAATRADHEIRVEQGVDGALAEIVIGAAIMANPLLPRFFRMLAARGIEDRRALELVRETFGGLAA
jgi:hypothetical protein